MATAVAVPLVPRITPLVHHNGFVRFIDAIGRFFVHAAPVIEKVAIGLEPVLAFTPFGPEYDLVVNAIVGAQQTAAASLAAGVGLTGLQKLKLVLEATTPALDAILTSKGVTAEKEAHIANWIQIVFNLLAGPVADIVALTHPTAA